VLQYSTPRNWASLIRRRSQSIAPPSSAQALLGPTHVVGQVWHCDHRSCASNLGRRCCSSDLGRRCCSSNLGRRCCSSNLGHRCCASKKRKLIRIVVPPQRAALPDEVSVHAQLKQPAHRASRCRCREIDPLIFLSRRQDVPVSPDTHEDNSQRWQQVVNHAIVVNLVHRVQTGSCVLAPLNVTIAAVRSRGGGRDGGCLGAGRPEVIPEGGCAVGAEAQLSWRVVVANRRSAAQLQKHGRRSTVA
jgi:hypothetical protein